MKKRQGKVALLVMALFALLACDELTWIIADMPPATPSEIPPFVITKPRMQVNERPFYFNYAGMVFNFLNQAEKTVEAIVVSFVLFDPETMESPFFTSNKSQITRWDTVFPGENKEIIISLDQFISVAPSNPYLVDLFYIYEIQYVDGSVWSDDHGKHRVRN
jgi:hypothetical protein